MEEETIRQINVNGRLMDLSCPQVMGILNITPDSFYAASRTQTEREIAARARQIIDEGGTIIDMGACSTRPGACTDGGGDEEMRRLRCGLAAVRRECPDAVVSVDTFRADVARMCVEEYGAAIINDISSGEMDAAMPATVAQLGVPYILVHMQGTPQTMQQAPRYGHVVKEVLQYLAEKIQRLRDLGAKDLLADPGFGFGKTQAHNYALLNQLEEFGMLGVPVVVGVSRKSMIYGLLGTGADDALNGTTAAHAIALTKGADILRVHDVKAASEAVRIFTAMKESSPSNH